MFTYEVAPFYNLVEKSVLDKMAKMVGWTEPADGLFNPGGSISNLYAVQAALHYFFPQHKQQGLFVLPKLVMFTSEHVSLQAELCLYYTLNSMIINICAEPLFCDKSSMYSWFGPW